jgi:pimeloyl-ACP methyl ester carboxylesterase
MKNFNKWIFLIIAVAGLTLNSCKDTNAPVPKEYDYYISNTVKSQVTVQDIKNGLALYQLALPDLPDVASFGEMVSTDIEVQKVTYKTTLQNKNVQASGLVYFPKTAGNYPVLSFQNGTNTEHSKAPSENPDSGMLFMLESVASMGFIVVIPDYIGFGASSNLPHPYLHAESSTQSILDMLRAVNELSTQDKIVAKPTKDLFIFGYSQGGWATMQLQKAIETSYSSEFTLIASSCGAGPYSLDFMNQYVTSKTDYPMPYFLTYILNAYKSLGLISNPLSDFVQEPYASKIPGLYDGLHSPGDINFSLTTKMTELLTPEYRDPIQFSTNPKFSALQSALVANSVKVNEWKISTPTRLYHGGDDELIPVSLSQKTFQDLKIAGASDSNLQLIIIPGYNHDKGAVPVGIATIKWFMELKK